MPSLTSEQKQKIANTAELIYSMETGGLCEIGEILGYEWNTVDDAIKDAEYYAEDGDGAFTVSRVKNHNDKKDAYSNNSIINHIMIAFFESSTANKLKIVNAC